MNIQRCIDDLLMRGADDWVPAPEIAWVAKSTGGATAREQIRGISLQLIREVVQQGLMEIGDLMGNGGRFRKWDMTDQEALAKVEREWKPSANNPGLSEVCWLRNTERGNEIGNRLLDQRKPSP